MSAPGPGPDPPADAPSPLSSSKKPVLDKNGWDGKLRHPSVTEKRAVLTNPEALTDSDYSDPDAPPVDQIEADEDLLDDYPLDSDEIDLVHCRISSLPALHLERFTKAKRICLRQNAISDINLPAELGSTLQELDLYDNLISHIRGFEPLANLETLDLSFNKIKHIKNLAHLTELRELYFVQNKISRIENLSSLTKLRMVELAANRIREIDGLDGFAESLEELWLGKNKIVEMKNLSQLSHLRLLDLKSNRIPAITGLSSLPQLEELYLSHNALTAISGLESNTALRVLDVSNNRIQHLEGLGTLAELEEFWASSNLFGDFKEVERELSGKEKLQTVYFEMNPLQLAGPAVYRNKVRLLLPQVRQIDASYVKVS